MNAESNNSSDFNKNPNRLLEKKIGDFQLDATLAENDLNIITTNSVSFNVSKNLHNTDKRSKRAMAQTLPIQSPHSPIHIKADELEKNAPVFKTKHIKAISSKQNYATSKTKLSARYINNKADTSPTPCYRIDTSILSSAPSHCAKTILHNEASTSSLLDTSSRLLCSCEKFLNEGNVHSKSTKASKNVQSISNNIVNTKLSSRRVPLNASTVEKRLILTRNAATSPNLDLRKLSSMTTLNASGNSIKSHKNLIELKNLQDSGDSQNYKNTLEKSKSLNKNGSLKLLRTARSLSPRPQIQHQHAIIVSEASDDDLEIETNDNTLQTLQYHGKNGSHYSPSLLNIKNNYDQMSLRRRKPHHTCRSEQSSPNVGDNECLKFEYNPLTNRSTDCLTYIPTDPWLKMTVLNSGSSNIKRKPLAYTTPMSNILSENHLDPWIKRNDNSTTFKTAEQEDLRQTNTPTVSKYFSRINETKNIPMLQHWNIPTQAIQEKYMSKIAVDKPLQSAPASPHMPITSDNSLSSIYFFNNNNELQEKRQKRKCRGSSNEMPIRSSSFSPIRARNLLNPFLNFNSSTNRTPVISIANDSKAFSSISGDTQFQNYSKSKPTTFNHNLLNASSCNLLQDRHSSSSLLITDHWRDEELQLNIRRLSDQTFRKDGCDSGVVNGAIQSSSNKNVWPNNIKPFCSDRNINQNYDDAPSDVINENYVNERNIGDSFTDNSKYLKQFRGNEAKQIDRKLKNTCTNNKSSFPATLDQVVNENNITDSADTLLETTC